MVDVKELIFLIVLVVIIAVPLILSVLKRKKMGAMEMRRIKHDSFMWPLETINGHSQDMESKGIACYR